MAGTRINKKCFHFLVSGAGGLNSDRRNAYDSLIKIHETLLVAAEATDEIISTCLRGEVFITSFR